MSPSGSPSAWRIAMDGWRMGWRAGGRMPWLLATSIIAWILLEAMVSTKGDAANGGDAWLWYILKSIADACIDASVAIAVYRFVLLGETSDRPVWRAPAQFGPYLGYTALLHGIAWLPGGIGPRQGFGPWQWLSLGLLLIAGILGPRFSLIFPATAIDAPGRGLVNCWNDTRGHYWRIFRILLSLLLVTFLILLPGLILTLVLRLAGLPEWEAFLGHFLTTAGQLFAYPEAAAFAVLYSHVANELRGPSAPPWSAITDRD